MACKLRLGKVERGRGGELEEPAKRSAEGLSPRYSRVERVWRLLREAHT